MVYGFDSSHCGSEQESDHSQLRCRFYVVMFGD